MKECNKAVSPKKRQAEAAKIPSPGKITTFTRKKKASKDLIEVYTIMHHVAKLDIEKSHVLLLNTIPADLIGNYM